MSYDGLIYKFNDLYIYERFKEVYLEGRDVGDGTFFFWETNIDDVSEELFIIDGGFHFYIPFKSILRPLLKKIGLEIINNLKEK